MKVKKYSLKDRAGFYNSTFGKKYPDSRLMVSSRWISGTWITGNNYRGSGYYGSYPPGYLKRISTLFPELERKKVKVLHLFSGSIEPGNYIRFDLNEEVEADVYGDAHELSTHFDPGTIDIIFADPPYSNECALHYGKPMVKRNTVIIECAKVLKMGGFCVWMDQAPPQYRKQFFNWCGAISIWRSTMHRVRGVLIFKKIGIPVEKEVTEKKKKTKAVKVVEKVEVSKPKKRGKAEKKVKTKLLGVEG